jgi:hypothetical protein
MPQQISVVDVIRTLNRHMKKDRVDYVHIVLEWSRPFIERGGSIILLSRGRGHSGSFH